ncbi:MAG: thioredoxin domain-containing protein [Nitrospiraceae bacterium]|nr:thioredoxin domain-containing protein [Nitrospiraceae bacterium]OQW66429.1 MAG: disulfide bond formation protein DsbA [Nitrospira sp. ST-bin5]
MTHSSKWGWRGALVAVGAVLALGTSVGVSAATPELKGKFEVLKDEKSTHQPGKVKLIEFADFYCPHCHRFDGEGVALLKKEFGDKIEVTMVGFPVFQGKLPTPFDMYEQARTMGKGDEMKKVLFRTIHTEKVTGVLDRSLREVLIKEVGLDPKAFEEGMASGKPAKALEESKKWGERIKVQQTPTVLIDGNIKVEQIDPDNLKLVIHSILDADKKK